MYVFLKNIYMENLSFFPVVKYFSRAYTFLMIFFTRFVLNVFRRKFFMSILLYFSPDLQ